jgi:hypothetical protein
MRSTVYLAFGADELSVNVPDDEPELSSADARRWLDEQFVANGCEPLRASGKVLTADKLLAIASAIGRAGFEKDATLKAAFARAAAAALARPTVRIDVAAGTVSY